MNELKVKLLQLIKESIPYRFDITTLGRDGNYSYGYNDGWKDCRESIIYSIENTKRKKKNKRKQKQGDKRQILFDFTY